MATDDCIIELAGQWKVRAAVLASQFLQLGPLVGWYVKTYDLI
jgi:hypothetical protein